MPTTQPSKEQQRLKVLLKQCSEGNQRALEKLYGLTSAHLYAQLLRIVKQEASAQECLQESFIKIWNNAAQYNEDRGEPMTWMSSIARYRALDSLRRQKVRPAISELELDHFQDQRIPGVERQVENRESISQLLGCLRALPPINVRPLPSPISRG